MVDDTVSPAHKRAATVKRMFEQALTGRREAAAALGGNLRVWIPQVASWTVVTRGPMTGVHDDGGKKLDARFSLTCDDGIVLQLVTGTLSDAAIADALEKKTLQFEGDVELFLKFTQLLA
jgi:hypothetical protein